MPFPKGPTRKAIKALKDRQAGKVVNRVREAVTARDGFCRLFVYVFEISPLYPLLGPCRGVSEWAHMGEWRRFKTRGMAPEARHTTGGSLKLCTHHHQGYDAHTFTIDGSAAGADRALTFAANGLVYQETERHGES